MIHYYYGFGKGKTSSAVGAGMRAYGAGMSVLFVQFFKDNKSSERSVLPFEVYPCPESLPFNVGGEYKSFVKKAVEYIKTADSDVIILDEFADLIPRFLSVDEMKSIFSSDKEYIITGHNYLNELGDIADYVTRFEKIKHPYDSGVPARKGIEF